MRITLAESLGMCFGVRDAIDMALDSPHRDDLTVLGELVHNPLVLQELEAAGVRMAGSADAPVSTGHVMVTAHGAAERVVDGLRERGLQVVEATCPLVRHAHRCLQRLASEGYFPVVIGRPDHVEVRGLVGDLDEYAVVLCEEDLDKLEGRARIGVVSQTTQPLEHVLALLSRIRARFPGAELKFRDTVCQPTKERQEAARRLAAQVDLVIVIGGRNSNNTHQLARTCRSSGAVAYQVESALDLRLEWFAGVEHVGITAGTSTPDRTIREVMEAAERLGREASWREQGVVAAAA